MKVGVILVGKLFCLLGKSGAGKDTLFEQVTHSPAFCGRISPVVLYTTRPKRESEVCGKHYHFVSVGQMDELERRGCIVEKRQYDTVHGVWHYFTAAFELPERGDLITITTPHGTKKLAGKIGAQNMVLIHLVASDKTRLERSIVREGKQTRPNYAEVCRRYLADEQDFADADFSGFAVFEIDANRKPDDALAAFKDIYNKNP